MNEEENLNIALKRLRDIPPRGLKTKGKFSTEIRPDTTYTKDIAWRLAANPEYS